jgi:hypothetical protein
MQVEWRRNKVLELLSKGDSQSDIAKVLQVDLSIISRDVYFLRQQAKTNIKRYIDERLPEEYEKCLVGLNAITKEAWNTAQQTEDKREKMQALSLAKECYSMKLDLLTNATVVDDAIRLPLLLHRLVHPHIYKPIHSIVPIKSRTILNLSTAVP